MTFLKCHIFAQAVLLPVNYGSYNFQPLLSYAIVKSETEDNQVMKASTGKKCPMVSYPHNRLSKEIPSVVSQFLGVCLQGA